MPCKGSSAGFWLLMTYCEWKVHLCDFDSLIVAKDFEVALMWFKYVLAKGVDKEFEANGLCPADVSSLSSNQVKDARLSIFGQ